MNAPKEQAQGLAVFEEVSEAAQVNAKAVHVFADCLREYMEKIHGGTYRAYVNHDDGIVVVQKL